MPYFTRTWHWLVSFSHAISQNTVTILLHASSIELLKAVAIYFRERTSDLEIRWYHRSSDAKPVPPLTKLPTYVPMHMCTYWLSPRGIKPDCNNNTKMKEKKERECKLGIEKSQNTLRSRQNSTFRSGFTYFHYVPTSSSYSPCFTYSLLWLV